MTNKSDKHKQESANNRCWNTIFFQKFNLALDKETDKQYHMFLYSTGFICGGWIVT